MYQSFIGLEVHIHLLTKTKVFCGCRAAFGDEPNTNVCPVCMGYPGVLPALNAEAMRMSAVVARALNCAISPVTWFERKQYFYPDMPKNYQISQFASPVGTNGYVDLEFHRNKKRIRIKECHLEEDAGKMIHAGNVSLLDYNRAGTSLLEIVTEPDFEIGEEAELFLQQLRRTVRYLGVCDGNMEEGSLRCDANVSVNLRGQGLGRKVEIKNLNSSRFVKLGLNYEILRQTEILEKGGTIKQETRLWNENRDQTESMRSKESAHDYRYFPEPDLPPFAPDQAFLAAVDASLVELPVSREARLVADLGLSEAQAAFVCEEKPLADYFEAAVSAASMPVEGLEGASVRPSSVPPGKLPALGPAEAAERVAAWLSSDVKRIMNRDSIVPEALSSTPLTPSRLAQLVLLIAAGRISSKIAKQTLEAVFSEDADPADIVARRGWEQITDPQVVTAAVDEVFAKEAQTVQEVASADADRARSLSAYLVGKVLAATGGRADPSLARRLVDERFSSRKLDIVSFGGAIAGKVEGDVVVPGELADLRGPFAADSAIGPSVQVHSETLGSFLSEEVSPAEWSLLVSALSDRLAATGDAETRPSGVVVAHGTDTLAYTAALVHWLFSRSSLPVVLAAASSAPASPAESAALLKDAALRALSGGEGTRAFVDGVEYPAVNLKFERLASPGFRTWNPDAPLPAAFDASILADLGEGEIRSRLEAATRSLMVVKIFPCLRADVFASLATAGYRNFILELYDTGTAPGGSSAYSLRDALRSGRERGAAFYCTSQQEGVVDFSGYVTAHDLWKEGAVPMGALTTESAYTRFVAAWLIAGDEAGARSLMEAEHPHSGRNL